MARRTIPSANLFPWVGLVGLRHPFAVAPVGTEVVAKQDAVEAQAPHVAADPVSHHRREVDLEADGDATELVDGVMLLLDGTEVGEGLLGLLDDGLGLGDSALLFLNGHVVRFFLVRERTECYTEL